MIDNSFLARRAVEAEYSDQPIMEYQGNPLIEALPPILSKEEVFDQLSTYPDYDPKERYLPDHYRYHCVMRITRYFQPWNKHYDLENRLSRAIRQGYIARNPLGRNYAMQLQQGYMSIKEQKYSGVINPDILTTSSGFTIIGISGIGKTKAIEHILTAYPQIIIHSEYNKQPLSLYQLPWLKLDCPFDGSLRGLCTNFFMKVDELLGSNYYELYGSKRSSTTNTMLPRMAQIASLHCIGVLIIDEIQHLSRQKSGGADEMLNFFVNLVNTIGIPVVLVGTNKARSVLQSAFRQARRGSGQGDMTWDLLQNDEVWDLLVTGMMSYQWTKKEIPCTQELKDALYEESQGIVDIGVKLYMMAQLRAISTGLETVNPTVVRKVAKENLQLVRPMIEALKSGRLSEIEKYDDIRPLNIEEFFQKNLSSVEFGEKIRLQRAEERRMKSEAERSLKESVILKLLSLDIEESIAYKLTEEVLSEQDLVGMSVNDVVKGVFKRFIIRNEEISSNSNVEKFEERQRRMGKEASSVTDVPVLSIIVAKGRKNKKSAYESLKEAGYIKSLP